MDGTLDVWDIIFKQNDPTLSLQVSIHFNFKHMCNTFQQVTFMFLWYLMLYSLSCLCLKTYTWLSCRSYISLILRNKLFKTTDFKATEIKENAFKSVFMVSHHNQDRICISINNKSYNVKCAMYFIELNSSTFLTSCSDLCYLLMLSQCVL